jgi:hypothetical protein
VRALVQLPAMRFPALVDVEGTANVFLAGASTQDLIDA